MSFLAKKWDDIRAELAEKGEEFTFEVTSPSGRVIPCGDLRVVKIRHSSNEKLHFILVHDRFKKE